MSTKNKIQAVNNTPKKLHEIKNTLDGYKPLPEKSSKRADLFEIMYHYSDELNDDSTCYFGHAAVHFASKKMQAAEKYYAHKCDYTDGYADTALNGFVALIDTTTFGKGDEGFYITEKKILGNLYLLNNISKCCPMPLTIAARRCFFRCGLLTAGS